MNTNVERELILKGRKFDFERITFQGGGGKKVTREVVRHPGAVVILPLLGDGAGLRIVMIRNRRYALGRELWELPAGTLEPPEDPARCAARELEEETGYRPDRVESLGSFYTTPGMTDELMRAYVASGLTHVGQHLEEDENIRPELVEPREAFSMLDRGELVDAKSMLTLLIAARRGLLAGLPGGAA